MLAQSCSASRYPEHSSRISDSLTFTESPRRFPQLGITRYFTASVAGIRAIPLGFTTAAGAVEAVSESSADH